MRRDQSGNTLLVSLIILLVLTIIGISSIGNVSLNLKMASSFRDADVAFQAAEAALIEGEYMVERLGEIWEEDFLLSSCSGEDCYSSQCNGGRCFSGTLTPGGSGPCQLTSLETPVYKEDVTWSDANRHFVAQTSFPGLSEDPKFIVEFMCFVTTDPSITPFTTAPGDPDEWAFLYRITSYARGANDASRVMLQSTYKVLRN